MRHPSTCLPAYRLQLQRWFLVSLLSFALLAASLVHASANPRYAAFVIDANTGQVLFARNADAQRFPASLTKMMTVYLIFEAIESGRVRRNTAIPISARAAAEQPTKVGLKAGSTISVEGAILTLVTRSANDIATAVGEFLGGSEAGFARMMTAKARQLGMNSTTFQNAHGLPNNGQVTTARDMAILGIALREHFPQHYSYFSTRSATVAGQRFNNHNRMLGRIEGVDGIKTGFIRASGFNLVSSVRSGGRSIVAVVMGGQTAASRDDHMAGLIREHLPRASRNSGGPLLAGPRIGSAPAVAAAGVPLPRRDIPTPISRPAEPVQAAAYAPVASARPTPPAPVAAPAAVAAVQAAVDPVNTSSVRPSGWAVQVAAAGSEREAHELLSLTTQRAGGVLSRATPFTETFINKGTTFYRARFGGFGTKDEAWNACNALKKRNIDCYAVQL